MKQKRHKCALVYKCLNKQVPQYLCKYFIRNYNARSYDTLRRTDLHLPKPKLSLSKRTFKCSDSALFHLLPCYIQNAEPLSFFIFLLNTNDI